MLALDEFEATFCDCGYPAELANDPDMWWTADVTWCAFCADREAQKRVTAQQDADEEKMLEKQPGAKRSSDGRQIRFRPMTPTEVAEAKAKASVGLTRRVQQNEEPEHGGSG